MSINAEFKPLTKYDLPPVATDPVDQSTDERIKKVVTALKYFDVHNVFDINDETIKIFLYRGGRIQLLEEGQQIPLKKGEHYIVGCGAGSLRSQAHTAYMEKYGARVQAILAGGNSAFNPKGEIPILSNPNYDNAEKEAFKTQFGVEKRPQLGSEFNNGIQFDWEKYEIVPGTQDYYQDFVNKLEPTHFIAYAICALSVLQRLLDSDKPTLEGFTLTFASWSYNPISYPRGDVIPYSQEAYRLFEEQLLTHFPIVD